MSSPKKISIIRVSQQKDGGPSGWGNLLPLKSARLADKKNRYGWAKCGEKKWTTGYKYIDDPPKNRHLGPLAANGRCGPWNIRRVVPIVFVRLFLPGAIVAERWRRWRCGARPLQTKQLRRRRLLLVRHLSSRHGDRYGLDGRARRTFHSISTPGLFFLLDFALCFFFFWLRSSVNFVHVVRMRNRFHFCFSRWLFVLLAGLRGAINHLNWFRTPPVFCSALDSSNLIGWNHWAESFQVPESCGAAGGKVNLLFLSCSFIFALLKTNFESVLTGFFIPLRSNISKKNLQKTQFLGN